MKEKKKGSKVAADSNRGTQYVVLIMEMLLKTELWKLKTKPNNHPSMGPTCFG